MKTKTLGIVVVVLGIAMMIYTGFNYVTTKNVVDLGAIQINKEENHPIHWSAIVGVVLLAGGVSLLVRNKKLS